MEKVKELDARLRFIEEILSIPSKAYACMTNPDDCPIKRDEADGCVLSEAKMVCPLNENKLDKLLSGFNEVRQEVNWPTEVLKELAAYGLIEAGIVELAEAKINLHRAIETLAIRRERLARFKRSVGLHPLVDPTERLVAQSDAEVTSLSTKTEELVLLLKSKQRS